MKSDFLPVQKLNAALLVLFSLCLPAIADAFECANAGAVGTAPEDHSFVTRTACGSGAESNGSYGVALGQDAYVSASYGTALGSDASSTANYGTAIGERADVNGNYGTSVGSRSFTSGASATAVGAYSTALEGYSSALGYGASAYHSFSVALGYVTTANANNAVVVGGNATVIGNHGVALGYGAQADAINSIALGYRSYAQQPHSMVLGSIAGVNDAFNSVDVAIGTTTPLAPLHVARDDGTAGILVQENAPDPAGRTLFTLANRGNTKFELKETGSGTRWQFTNSGDAFRVSKFGTGQVEFQVFNNGDAVLLGDLAIGGSFTEMSDRNQKHAIVPLDGEAILAKVAQVPISEWSYKTESADQRHIGPMAQDFYAAFGLASGETRISARDMAGVALASIQVLTKENRELKAELSELKALMMQLMPQAARN